MDSAIPVVVAIIAAILGGLGGVAAILKVQSDNSSSVATGASAVAEGAKTVIDLMSDRLDENEALAQANTKRLDALEDYVSHFDAWADRLLAILDRAITALPDALREQFAGEADSLKLARPKREAGQRAKARAAAAEKVEQAALDKR
jgi:ABC-type transporter Mla subunit MlaD